MPIEISDDLRQKLLFLRKSQLRELREKVERPPNSILLRYFYDELQSIDGIHLWGTLGADLYLTFDGRVLLSEDRVDRGQSIQETSKLAYKAIGFTTGAFVNDLPELLDFLPNRPRAEPPCQFCQGERMVNGEGENLYRRACGFCCGLGWGKQLLD